MNNIEIGSSVINEVCQALSVGDIEKGREIIQKKYPHKKPLKARKSFTPKEQLKIFLRDGFIDRYSGNKLIFPGVLCILSHLLPMFFHTKHMGKPMNVIKRGGIYFQALIILYRLHLVAQMAKKI